MAHSLSGERPFTAAAPSRPLLALRRWLAAAHKAHARRMALKALLDLDDANLRDMGVTRQDILVALTAPARSGHMLHRARARSAQL